MKCPRLFAALFAFTLTTVAQTPPPTPPKPSVPPGRVVGTVLCSDTRKPCRGAEVFLGAFSGGADVGDTFNFETITGIDGTYAFENLPPGKYVAIANLPGYLSGHIYIWPQPEAELDTAARDAQRIAWAQSLQVIVASSQTSTHDITLLRGASLNGRILYADGAPAIHAFIRVEHADPDQKSGESDKDHHIVPTPQDATFTNDVGQFRIPSIRPGRYRVAAVPHLQDTEQSGDYNPPTFAIYSGDTIHRKAAKVYELRLNDDVSGIDITIPIGGLHRVSGRLATTDDHPLNMGTLTLTSADDETVSYRTEVDHSGAFTFSNVPPGAYALALANAFIGAPSDPTRYPHRGDTDLKPTRAFAADILPILVKDSDLSDLAPALKEIPLPPKPKVNEDDH